MTNNRQLNTFIMSLLTDLVDVRSISMMGGYIFYYRDRIFGGIYGDKFMVKITDASKKALPHSVSQPPYEGAKPMLLITDIKDKNWLQDMVISMYDELPERKVKKKQQNET